MINKIVFVNAVLIVIPSKKVWADNADVHAPTVIKPPSSRCDHGKMETVIAFGSSETNACTRYLHIELLVFGYQYQQ